MRIAITGASGMVGSALVPALTEAGHTVQTLSRGKGAAGSIAWDPAAGTIDAAALEGVDALVHLAGEPIAHRWSRAVKQRILESRREGTRLLAETLAKLARPPGVFVSTSASGYYGDRGDDVIDETAPPGTDFLAEVCQAWEAATAPAAARGIRTVILRVGIVMSPKGGALGKMLTPFKLGAGGRIGTGKQWMSWIAIDDLVAAYQAALANPALAGPVNAVAPTAVTNRDFTRTLGRVLGRPTFIPLPAFAVKTLFGVMGQTVLLTGQHILPARLTAAGFGFRYPDLESALRHLLGR